MAKKATKELPGMPELDSAGKIAVRLQEVNKDIAEAYQSREDLEQQLIEIMKSTGRERIKVGDCLFVMHVIASKVKIVIRRDKGSAKPESMAEVED